MANENVWLKMCTKCNGSGTTTCPTCRGTGQKPTGTPIQFQECGVCWGKGYWTCTRCGGKGTLN